MLETADMQGMILSGYGSHPSAAYLFLSILDPPRARQWLKDIASRITTGGVYDRNRDSSLNIALTYKGLARLGLSEATLATFSRPFAEDMAHPARERLLGDTPESWAWGKPDHAIHVLLMVFGNDPAALARQRAAEQAYVQGALQELFAIESEFLPQRPGHLEGEEHFGFLDGLAQPVIAGHRPGKSAHPANQIQPGEFILGYLNEYGQHTASPKLRPPDSDPGALLPAGDLGRNGTYLVLRQLHEDVAGFWNMLRDKCRRDDGSEDPPAEETLAAKIVGRWRDGTPVTVSPDKDGGDPARQDSFGYASDPYGERCPFGAHIRRANPRETLLKDPAESIMTNKRHRLLRRGRPYGPPLNDRYQDDGTSRGLVFITLCANIERQFEFVQHAWITSPNFAGLYDEADPLLGGRTESQGAFTMPGCPVRQRLQGILPHISTKGGAYFFLPGVRALRWLGR